METTVEISNKEIASLLVSAIENTGHMSTWLQSVEFVGPDAAKVNEGYDWYAEGKSFNDTWGMKVQCDDPKDHQEGNAKFIKTIHTPDLEAALHLLAKDHPRHFGDLISENADAITADVFIQLAIYGECHYG